MNRKRKVLTVAGLVAFAVIVWAHIANEDHIRLTTLLVLGAFYAGLYALMGGEDKPRNWRRIIKITALACAGLLVFGGLIVFVLHAQEQETTRKQQVAFTQFQQRQQSDRIEKEQREQAAAIEKEKAEQYQRISEEKEKEASRQRITQSEIDLIDLQLTGPKISWETNPFPESATFGDITLKHTGYPMTGRIRNRSIARSFPFPCTCSSTEKEGSRDVLGEAEGR